MYRHEIQATMKSVHYMTAITALYSGGFVQQHTLTDKKYSTLCLYVVVTSSLPRSKSIYKGCAQTINKICCNLPYNTVQ